MVPSVHIEETERQALTRLLGKAKAEGVTIVRDRTDGRHYASSVSTPGTMHYVTAYSCDCRGFVAHHRCKHHSALLAAMGWLTVDPEPTTPMQITVAHVDGYYSLPGLNHRGGEWQEPRTEIAIDGRDVIRVTGDDWNVQVHWIDNGRPIENTTAVTPTSAHYDAVVYWLRSLTASVDIDSLLQDAGLFPAGEFVDAEPIAA